MTDQPHPLKRAYGVAFDHFWRLRNAKAASLAAGAMVDTSYLYLVRQGRRVPSLEINKRLDAQLDAGGLLVTLGIVIEEEVRRAGRGRHPTGPPEAEGSVQRRVLLQQALAALASGTPATAAALEAIREGLASSLTGGEAPDLGVDEWEEVAYEYGRAYLVTPPDALVSDLAADVVDVQQRLDRESDEARRFELSRISAQLAAIMAMTLTNLGRIRAAHRWWRTARQAADASRDTVVQTWVRSEEAIRGLYTHRPPQTVINIADEALAIGSPACAAQAMAAKAQALAIAGRADEAREVVQGIEPVLDRMSTDVLMDRTTVYGWPETCLWHTQSYVYAHIGDTGAAERAQQQALARYSPTEQRSRTQIKLHEAMCLVSAGDIDSGAAYAQQVIAELPPTQRTTLVLELGHQVLRSVPPNERARSPVSGLFEVLALPAGHGEA